MRLAFDEEKKIRKKNPNIHCPKFKAEFRSIERSADGIKLHREKYNRDFIPYNLPELFQGCEKLEKLT
jgi:hypothetical protein